LISSQFYPSISNCLDPHARCVNQQVRCGGEEFEMHASVVTCGSEYFRAILEHAMAESGLRAFEMHEVQPRVLERVVEWLYSGEVGEISGVAEGLALLEGSRFLRVERMEAQCSTWVCAHVEASNCVWAEASRLGCGVVAERALLTLVVGRRLAAVAGKAEFLGLSREALLELVRSEGLAARQPCGASGWCTRL
jgi:kelch-like protein 19